MQRFTATFAKNECICQDFIEKKTCPSYEFLVFSGQVLPFWDRKNGMQGGHELGWSAGRVRVQGGSGQAFSNSFLSGAGLNFAGRERTKD